MVQFKYQYKGEVLDASYFHYLHDGYNRYRVFLPDGQIFVVARLGIDPRIWTQSTFSLDDYSYPHDFIQAVGEGIDKIGSPETPPSS
jgi:hypothetical protein